MYLHIFKHILEVLDYLKKATILISQFTSTDVMSKGMSPPAQQAFEKIGDLFFELEGAVSIIVKDRLWT